MDEFRNWLDAKAEIKIVPPEVKRPDDSELDNLFVALKRVADSESADQVEEEIWRIWTVAGERDLDRLMVRGIFSMSREKYNDAMDAFDEIINRAPGFAKGWNKRAMVRCLRGDYVSAVDDIEQALALEPRHFGALSGLGMVSLALGEEERALEAFETALDLHPHISGADTHIKELRERVKGRAA